MNFSKATFNGFFIADGTVFKNTIFKGAKSNIDELDLANTIYEGKGLPIDE